MSSWITRKKASPKLCWIGVPRFWVDHAENALDPLPTGKNPTGWSPAEGKKTCLCVRSTGTKIAAYAQNISRYGAPCLICKMNLLFHAACNTVALAPHRDKILNFGTRQILYAAPPVANADWETVLH